MGRCVPVALHFTPRHPPINWSGSHGGAAAGGGQVPWHPRPGRQPGHSAGARAGGRCRGRRHTGRGRSWGRGRALGARVEADPVGCRKSEEKKEDSPGKVKEKCHGWTTRPGPPGLPTGKNCFAALYCIVLYCTASYYTVLHCTAQ